MQSIVTVNSDVNDSLSILRKCTPNVFDNGEINVDISETYC
jgi:hypothetical protein